jgi:hypothetical protein
VIYLGKNGEIEKVAIPRDGDAYPVDIRALFPPDVQERIFANEFGASEAEKQIEERMLSGGPPLIVKPETP